MESIIGKILCDRYRIIQELESQSSMNQVYLAEDLVLDGSVTCQLKRYQPQYDNEILGSQSWQQVYQGFLNQGKILQKVSQHPQIPQLLDFFECDREFYLVLEQVEGENLEQRVNNSLLRESEAISWLQDVAHILDFLHQAGVAHLNLQPASLIYHRDGRKFVTNPALMENILLTDFSAWQNSFNPQLFPLNQTQKTNFQSDIYTLGQTIIYALTGDFLSLSEPQSLDDSESLNRENQDSLAASNISSELTNILRKMMAQEPAKCYQVPNQLLGDLEFKPNVITLPPPVFDSPSWVMAPPAKVERQSDHQSTTRIKFQVKKVLQTVWLWLSFPFIIAGIIFLIGINKNPRHRLISYANDDYQFAIKYPHNWSQRQLDDPITGEVVVFTSPQETADDLFRERLSIAVEYLPSETISLEQYTQNVLERINQAKGNQVETYADYRTTVDNLPARKVIYSRQEGELQLKQMETFTIRNNQVYIAIYMAERAKFSKFYDSVEQIIDSWEIQ